MYTLGNGRESYKHPPVLQFQRELEQRFERRAVSLVIRPFQGFQQRSPIAWIVLHRYMYREPN